MSVKKVMQIVGARPQFIKSAPVERAFRNSSISLITLHTGQHYDPMLSDIFFEQLDLQCPRLDLGIGSGSHAEQTATMMKGCAEFFEREQPDLVLVYGDTNSTLAGALAAARMDIPVAHIEAGLRSHDLRMPEETNRIAADHCSTLLFCTAEDAAARLKFEGMNEHSNIHVVGDVMLDNSLYFQNRAPSLNPRFSEEPFVLCTIHRASNTAEESEFRALVSGLADLASSHRKIVLVEHPRWGSQGWDVPSWIGERNMRIIPAQGYVEMQKLIADSEAVVTDSGGLQKEAFFLKKPCILLRDRSEWTALVDLGHVRLCDNNIHTVGSYLDTLDEFPSSYPQLYGDGSAAEKIFDIIHDFLQPC